MGSKLSIFRKLLFCKRLQGTADARRGYEDVLVVLQVPGNKAGAVPCERLPISIQADRPGPA
jgi:hypothetical protein